MIKYLFIAFTLALIFTSCSDTDTVDADLTSEDDELVDNFTISGVISGASNTVFYLEAQSQQGTIAIAQATADASGNFKMKGNVPGLGMYQLRMGEATDKILLLTLSPDDDLTITATSETYASNPKATGTKWAKVMSEYILQVSAFRDAQAELMELQGTIDDEELEKRYLEQKAIIDEFALSNMKADPSNPFNIVLSTYAVPSMDFQNWDPKSLDVLKNVADAFTKKYADSPISATLSNQVYQIELAYNQHTANSSGTRTAPEIALNNPAGQEIRLSSLRGKYVLIDFWASWCAPCRRESPNVVRMYNKYKDQGFTVYSVSLDDNAEKWKGAIAQDGLIWPNHVSDLLQWKSPMPQLYGFNGIPYTVLVNKEGNIIGTGLRGPALEQKLKEIFEN